MPDRAGGPARGTVLGATAAVAVVLGLACGRTELDDPDGFGGAGAGGQGAGTGGDGTGGKGGAAGGAAGAGGAGRGGGTGGGTGGSPPLPGRSLRGCPSPRLEQIATILPGAALADAAWLEGAGFGLLWTAGEYRLGMTLLVVEGKLIRERTLLETRSGISSPRLAAAGDRFGVVWADSRDGDPRIYFRPVEGSLGDLDEDRAITSGADVSQVAIAWTGKRFVLQPGKLADDIFILDEEGVATNVFPFGRKLAYVLPGRPLVGGPLETEMVLATSEPCGDSEAPSCLVVRRFLAGKEIGRVVSGNGASAALTVNPDGPRPLGAVIVPDVRLFFEAGSEDVLSPYGRPSSEVDLAWVGGDAGIVAWGGAGDSSVQIARWDGKTRADFSIGGLPGGAKRIRVVAAADSVGVFVTDFGRPGGQPTTRYARIRCV